MPIWLNGASRIGVVQASLQIDLNTGSEPHRCAFDFKGGNGYVPLAGHTVVIGHGTTANPLFSGRIQKATRTGVRSVDRRPIYRVECAGHVMELAHVRVTPGLSTQSVGPQSIARAVLAATSPSATAMGFSADGVDGDLPMVGEFTITATESVPEALGRLFRLADATWYVDHNRRVRAFASVDSLTTIPSTLTVPSTAFWDLSYTPTDLARVFTRVQVVGAGQSTLADYLPARHVTMPLPSASLIANQNGSTGDDVFVASSERYLIDGLDASTGFFYRPEAQFNAGKASVALPSSRNTNTLTVVSADVGGISPLDPDRWYDIGGQLLYIASTAGVFSTSGGSIAYSYWLHSSGSGAMLADINAGADIAAPWNLTINSATRAAMRPIVPAGTAVNVLATRVNSTARDYVSSLMGSATFGLISKTITDERLGVDGAADVALGALERGDPAQWQVLEFETRDPQYEIGRPVFASVTSLAESGAAAITGAFTAHDVKIGGFGQLTDSKGPIRRITAGTTRKPTLWQVLQGL